MNIALINPNLVVQKNDPLTTGIVYMPILLAYSAAALEKAGHAITVIDGYGLNPRQVRHDQQFWFFGLSEKEIVERIPDSCGLAVIFANQLTNHLSLIRIIFAIKQACPSISVAVLENSQAVTAYALDHVENAFYAAGADYLVIGDGEETLVELAQNIKDGKTSDITGICRPNGPRPVRRFCENLDQITFPAWHFFPLEQYWKLGFGHGPVTANRYLPLLTSRGCPYSCRFCVSPKTTENKWRGRSAENVVDEIQKLTHLFGVNEFHWEDLNPTVNDQRIRQICESILNRNLKLTWKLVSGTKAETIRDRETIKLMARAGCSYISISPETGSAKILKSMNKPFDLDHARTIVDAMNKNRIRSQACFVLGFPDETGEDRIKTRNLVKALTQDGVDEVALFIITPVPGSEIFIKYTGYKSLSELNFTPVWREDYRELVTFRKQLYRKFLLWKLMFHPLKILAQPLFFLTRRFRTKMEMVPYRALKLWLWSLRSTVELD